ncbi:MAG: hypothetical protein ACI8ZN_002382 [Bacteroidia bacterium]|jgi:hypothetical protein
MPKSQNQKVFWLFCLGLAGFLFLPELMKQGMFFDGLAYSTVSFSMANGLGSFWEPALSVSMWNPFYGHPPLVLFLQAKLFQLLGNHWFIERIYAILIFGFNTLVLVAIWKRVSENHKHLAWYAVLLWLISPGIYTFFARNLLEPTMALFTLSSILFFIRSLQSQKRSNFFLGLSVLAVLCAFLAKGPIGLFPLCMPFLHAFFVQKRSAIQSIVANGRMLIYFALTTAFLLSFEAPRTSILAYLNEQVITSIAGEGRNHVDGRLHIIWVFLEESMYMVFLSILIGYLSYRKFGWKLRDSETIRWGVFFIAISICSAFPVALSPKQSSFYILASFAPLALGCTCIISEALELSIMRLKNLPWFSKVALPFVSLLIVSAFIFNWQLFGSYRNKDAIMITDVKTMISYLPKKSPITTNETSFKMVTSIHAYLQRYGQLDLDTTERPITYVLRLSDTIVPPNYIPIDLPLKLYHLYYYPANQVELESL